MPARPLACSTTKLLNLITRFHLVKTWLKIQFNSVKVEYNSVNTKMFTVHVETMPEFKPGLRIGCVDINKSTGDIIVETLHEPLLYKFHLQQNGSYRQECRCQLPENVKRHCSKYLMDTGNVILHNQEDSTTFMFDQDMKLVDSWQHQGRLIATLSGTRAVYTVGKGLEWHVEIRIQDGDILQLKPDGSTWEDKYLRVCGNARTEKLVVMHTSPFLSSPHILDIFHEMVRQSRDYTLTLSISVFVYNYRLQENSF